MTGGGPAGSWTPGPYRSSNQRASIAVTALGGAIGASLATALVAFQAIGIEAARRAGTLTAAQEASHNAFLQTANSFWLIAMLASIIGVLAWLSRSVDNAPSLGAGVPRRSPREAILWWFVPFATLIVPYMVVHDLYTRMETARRPGVRWLLPVWWICWLAGQWFLALVSLVLAAAAANPAATQVQVDQLQLASDWIAVVSNIFTAAAGVLFILVIWQIERCAFERAHLSGADRYQPAPDRMAWPIPPGGYDNQGRPASPGSPYGQPQGQEPGGIDPRRLERAGFQPPVVPPAPPPEPIDPSRRCPRCGEPRRPYVRFCARCGFDMGWDEIDDTTEGGAGGTATPAEPTGEASSAVSPDFAGEAGTSPDATPAPPPDPSSVPRACPRCGRIVGPYVRYCGGCGGEVL